MLPGDQVFDLLLLAGGRAVNTGHRVVKGRLDPIWFSIGVVLLRQIDHLLADETVGDARVVQLTVLVKVRGGALEILDCHLVEFLEIPRAGLVDRAAVVDHGSVQNYARN